MTSPDAPVPPAALPQQQPFYPPPYLAAPPPNRPPRRWKPWELALIIGGCAVLIGGLVVAYVLSNGFTGGGNGTKPEVAIVACTYDGAFTHLTYRLTNEDDVAHDYRVTGTVGHQPLIPDTLVGIAPGETVSGEMLGPEEGDCRLTGVNQH